MTPLTLVEVDKLCRLCLKGKGEVSAFAFHPETTIAETIWDCVAIRILPDDSLPTLVCNACVSSLNAWSDFKKVCHEARALLASVNPQLAHPTPRNNACNNVSEKEEGVPSETHTADEPPCSSEGQLTNGIVCPFERVKEGAEGDGSLSPSRETPQTSQPLLNGIEPDSISLRTEKFNGGEESSIPPQIGACVSQEEVDDASSSNGDTTKSTVSPVDELIGDSLSSKEEEETAKDAISSIDIESPTICGNEAQMSKDIDVDSTPQDDNCSNGALVNHNDSSNNCMDNDLEGPCESNSSCTSVKSVHGSVKSCPGGGEERTCEPDVMVVPLILPPQVVLDTVDISDESDRNNSPLSIESEASPPLMSHIKIESAQSVPIELFNGNFNKPQEERQPTQVDDDQRLVRCGPNIFSCDQLETIPHQGQSNNSVDAADEFNYGDFSTVSIKEEPLYEGYEEHESHPGEKMGPPQTTDLGPEWVIDSGCGEIGGEDTCICTACDRKYSSYNQYIKHIRSKVHKRCASLVGSRRKSDFYKPLRGFIFCRPCSLQVNCQESWNLHTQTDRHKDRARKFQSSFSEGSPKTPFEDSTLFCQHCSIGFKSRYEKLKHNSTPQHRVCVAMRRGANMVQLNKFMCPYKGCSQSFKEGCYLINHMMKSHSNLPKMTSSPTRMRARAVTSRQAPSTEHFFCRKCHTAFQSAVARSSHQKTCGKLGPRVVKPFNSFPPKQSKPSTTCTDCNLRFVSVDIFHNHMKTFHNVNPPSAIRIGHKSLKLKSQGVRLSTLRKPTGVFKCPHCPKTFDFITSLNIHKRMHTAPESPTNTYVCKICQRSFTSAKYYKRHVRSHFLPSGSKDHFCCGCYQTFGSRMEITKHKLRDGCPSLKLKIYTCSLCKNSYNQLSALKAHKVESHPGVEAELDEVDVTPVNEGDDDDSDRGESDSEELKTCSICQKTFASRPNYLRHMKLHEKSMASVKCNYCESFFASAKMARAHADQCPALKEDNQSLTVPFHLLEPDIEIDLDVQGDVVNTLPLEASALASAIDNPEGGVNCPYCDKHLMYKKNLAYHVRVSCPRVSHSRKKCLKCRRLVTAIKKNGVCLNCTRSSHNISSKKATMRAMMRHKLKREGQDPNVGVSSANGPFDYTKAKRNDENLFQCPYGQRKFLHKNSLLKHLPTCRGNCELFKLITCKHCKNSFDPAEYTQHRMTCRGEGGVPLPLEPDVDVHVKSENEPRRPISKRLRNSMGRFSKATSLETPPPPKQPTSLPDSWSIHNGVGALNTPKVILTPHGKRFLCCYCDRDYSKSTYTVQHTMKEHPEEFAKGQEASGLAAPLPSTTPSRPLKRKRSISPGKPKKRKFCSPCKRFFRNSHAYAAHMKYHKNQAVKAEQVAARAHLNESLDVEEAEEEEESRTTPRHEANCESDAPTNSNQEEEGDTYQICKICNKSRLTLKQLYKHTYYCIKKLMMRGETYTCLNCRETFDKNDTTKQFSTKAQNHCLSCYNIPYAPGEVPDSTSTKLLCFICCLGFASYDSQRRHIKAEHYRKRESLAGGHSEEELKREVKLEEEEEGGGAEEEEEGPCSPDASTLPKDDDSQGSLYKSYPCPHCSEVFLLTKHLRSHLKSNHRTSRPIHQCKECARTFANLTKLKNHEKVHSIVVDRVLLNDQMSHFDPPTSLQETL